MTRARKRTTVADRAMRAVSACGAAFAVAALAAPALAANPQQTFLGLYEETSAGSCTADTCKAEFNLRDKDMIVKMMSCKVQFSTAVAGTTLKTLVLSEKPLDTIEYVELPRYIPQANGTSRFYMAINAPMNHILTKGSKPFFKVTFQQKLGTPAATVSCTMAGRIP